MRYTARRNCADKENTMVENKDLRAINAELVTLLARSDVGPEQKKHVEKALEELRRFRRKRNPTRNDVFSCVRDVSENLLNAFLEDWPDRRF
jgi:hypothetical protein